jgi:hypothetical protein
MMRLRWMGDSRDYVKWDCVFENAKGRFVFYIPMLRDEPNKRCMHREVQNFFDQKKSLYDFKALFPHGFEVFEFGKDYSKRDADSYFQLVTSRLTEIQQQHGVLVFIDPDTGVEPISGPADEHVRLKDLGTVWRKLRPKDCLVIYQHASRDKNWKAKAGKHVSICLGLENDVELEPHCNVEMAADVGFLVLEKSR